VAGVVVEDSVAAAVVWEAGVVDSPEAGEHVPPADSAEEGVVQVADSPEEPDLRLEVLLR
jgi:hypothetical protein